MLKSKAPIVRVVLPGIIGAILGASCGAIGAVASLAPTFEMALLGMAYISLLGGTTGALIGMVGELLRTPPTLTLLGSSYAFAVGVFAGGAMESLLAGYGRSLPIATSIGIITLVTWVVGTISGSVPNIVWYLYRRSLYSNASSPTL